MNNFILPKELSNPKEVRLSDKDFELLLDAVKEKGFQAAEIGAIGKMLTLGMSVKDAIENADDYTVKSGKFLLNKKALARLLIEHHAKSASDLFRIILKKEDKDILF